jgi:hypothetical protein
MDATSFAATTIGAPKSQDTPKVDPALVKPLGDAPPEAPSPAAAPTAEPAKPKDDHTSRFATLLKKERENVKRQEEIKAREAALAEKEKGLSSMEQLRKQVAENPLKALELLGVTYQQVTDFVLKGEQPTPDLQVQGLKNELEELKKRLEDKDKNATEEQKRRSEEEFNKTLNDFKAGVDSFIESNAEKFELLNTYKGGELVMAIIEQHYQDTKKAAEESGQGSPVIMKTEQACELAEKFYEGEVEKALGLKKVTAKVNPQPKEESKPDSPAQQRATLTNQMSSSAPSMLPAATEADRMKRALAKLEASK